MPCRAAVNSALVLGLVGEAMLPEEREDNCEDWESREGKERSVELLEKAWLNQPDSLVGRSPILEVDGDEFE